MKKNTKSSITLPPSELKLVEKLMKKTGSKTKVEVVRKGLLLLEETTNRDLLRSQFEKASFLLRDQTENEVAELDALSDEGLD